MYACDASFVCMAYSGDLTTWTTSLREVERKYIEVPAYSGFLGWWFRGRRDLRATIQPKKMQRTCDACMHQS